MKEDIELTECDDCGAVKPASDFGSPGHTAGGQVNGFDIDSNVCTECGQRGYDKLQADLCEAAVAEMAAEEDAPRLLLWIPGLPIALVKGRTKNYLVNYELRTCGCPNHRKGHNRNCRHIAHVVGLLPLREMTEPQQYAKGLWL